MVAVAAFDVDADVDADIVADDVVADDVVVDEDSLVDAAVAVVDDDSLVDAAENDSFLISFAYIEHVLKSLLCWVMVMMAMVAMIMKDSWS